jgi:hypothetical protein
MLDSKRSQFGKYLALRSFVIKLLGFVVRFQACLPSMAMLNA